jgi:hypothetical protein
MIAIIMPVLEITILLLGIYALVLFIKALQIYINNNK